MIKLILISILLLIGLVKGKAQVAHPSNNAIFKVDKIIGYPEDIKNVFYWKKNVDTSNYSKLIITYSHFLPILDFSHNNESLGSYNLNGGRFNMMHGPRFEIIDNHQYETNSEEGKSISYLDLGRREYIFDIEVVNEKQFILKINNYGSNFLLHAEVSIYVHQIGGDIKPGFH